MEGKQELDREMLNELVEVMGREFRTLVNSFLQDGDRRIAALEQAIREGDGERVRQVAHGFKGSSSNLGVPRLADLCWRLENLARSDELDEAGSTLAEAREVFRRARRELNDLFGGQ